MIPEAMLRAYGVVLLCRWNPIAGTRILLKTQRAYRDTWVAQLQSSKPANDRQHTQPKR